MSIRLSTVAVLLASSSIASAEIGTGLSSQNVTLDGYTFVIETYRPSCSNPDLLVVHHGASRNTYMSGAEDLADQECLVVVAPIFPEDDYPSYSYQRGRVVYNTGAIVPHGLRTVRFEPLIVDWARAELGGDPDVYLFGFSAGGQYLSRVAAYEPIDHVTRFVVASPSTHVLPSLTEAVPYGFEGWIEGEEEFWLREYLALPLTIIVGSEDDDPNSSDLATGEAAMRQGDHRLERAQNTFEMGEAIAAANGWAFNWTFLIADGVGHSGSSMLRASEMSEALNPPGELPCECPEPEAPVLGEIPPAPDTVRDAAIAAAEEAWSLGYESGFAAAAD